jgi:hypothetical protein
VYTICDKIRATLSVDPVLLFLRPACSKRMPLMTHLGSIAVTKNNTYGVEQLTELR